MTSNDGPEITKPIPRRNFTLGDSFDQDESNTNGSTLFTPDMKPSNNDADTLPIDKDKRSQSYKNLTKSALFGIYGSAYDSIPPTPGITRDPSLANLADFQNSDGSSLPSQRSRPLSSISRQKRRQRPGTPKYYALLLVRLGLLFVSGAAYGFLVASLHDSGRVVPVNLDLDRYRPFYITIWGLAGVGMGTLLPWIDDIYEEYMFESAAAEEQERLKRNGGISPSHDYIGSRTNDLYKQKETTEPSWNPMVRSVGTFIGIAYAIRKLPWESTSQASATLALVNPVLWYLIDRSITGFWLSTFLGIFGTVILVALNPSFIVPAMVQFSEPYDSSITLDRGLRLSDLSNLNNMVGNSEFIGVITWIASVLYCSSVCFGNIGRLLVKIGERKEMTGVWMAPR